ncbi:hypothetical protein DIPPA_12525 [Diplonema papillatum]|nr:hypothetical protein DIPPA_12525 [Diplonema papillatum]
MHRVAWVFAAAALAQAAPEWITSLDLSTSGWDASLCKFDTHLDGVVLLPDAKCCNGTVVDVDAACNDGDVVNAGLKFPGGIITGDCVWKLSTVVIAARSTQDVEWAVQLLSQVHDALRRPLRVLRQHVPRVRHHHHTAHERHRHRDAARQ